MGGGHAPSLIAVALLLACTATTCSADRAGAFVNYFEDGSSAPLGTGPTPLPTQASPSPAQPAKAADATAPPKPVESPVCKDDDKSCADWAAKGECSRNAKFMRASCMLACGLCTVPAMDPKAARQYDLHLETQYGTVALVLLHDLAPGITSLVVQLALQARCLACSFYRNEPPPPPGSSGPPYGLLQGSLGGLTGLPPSEGRVLQRRGMVSFIPDTTEFFIAAIDHSAWAGAHLVWAQVAEDGTSMATVDTILALPYHNFTHPDYGTVMRMLLQPVAIRPVAVRRLLPGGGAASGAVVL